MFSIPPVYCSKVYVTVPDWCLKYEESFLFYVLTLPTLITVASYVWQAGASASELSPLPKRKYS